MFTSGLSIESLLHPIFLFVCLFFFFQVTTYAFVFVLDRYTCIDLKKLMWVPVSSTGKVFDGCIRDLEFNLRLYQKLIGYSLSHWNNFFPNKQLLSLINYYFLIVRIYFLKLRDKINNTLFSLKLHGRFY